MERCVWILSRKSSYLFFVRPLAGVLSVFRFSVVAVLVPTLIAGFVPVISEVIISSFFLKVVVVFSIEIMLEWYSYNYNRDIESTGLMSKSILNIIELRSSHTLYSYLEYFNRMRP